MPCDTHTCFLNKPSLKCGHSICVVLFICKAKALLAVFGFCLANCTKDALLKAVVVLHNQYWMQPQSLTQDWCQLASGGCSFTWPWVLGQLLRCHAIKDMY